MKASNDIEICKQRAAFGDADAQFEVAWEYFRGEKVERNIESAIDIFRQLEIKAPEVSRFNIAKIKILTLDDTYSNDIECDLARNFGPSLYLMGFTSQKIGKYRTCDFVL